MKLEDIEKMAEKSEKAVINLSEPFKIEGFKIILQSLMQESTHPTEVQEKHQRKKHTKSKVTKTEMKKTSPESGIVKKIITSKIQLDKYNYIHDLEGVAIDLAILKLVEDEFDFDGLIPAEISLILKKKFKILRSVNASSMMLGRKAGAFVDRTPEGQSYRYTIMKQGIDFLQSEIDKKPSTK